MKIHRHHEFGSRQVAQVLELTVGFQYPRTHAALVDGVEAIIRKQGVGDLVEEIVAGSRRTALLSVKNGGRAVAHHDHGLVERRVLHRHTTDTQDLSHKDGIEGRRRPGGVYPAAEPVGLAQSVPDPLVYYLLNPLSSLHRPVATRLPAELEPGLRGCSLVARYVVADRHATVTPRSFP